MRPRLNLRICCAGAILYLASVTNASAQWMNVVPTAQRGNGGGSHFLDACLNTSSWPTGVGVTQYIGAFAADIENHAIDVDLANCFSNMKAQGLLLSVEANGFAPGACGLGSNCFDDIKVWLHHWIDELGAPRILVRMDEPLSKGTRDGGRSFDDTLYQTVQFMSLVRSEFAYAYIQIGDIEPYPLINYGEIGWWMTSLHNQGSDPDLIELDNNWQLCQTGGGCTEASEIYNLESSAHFLGYSFGYIFGSPVSPSYASTWEQQALQQGDFLRNSGIVPDIYTFESWESNGQPSVITPESPTSTLTGTIAEFRNDGYFPR